MRWTAIRWVLLGLLLFAPTLSASAASDPLESLRQSIAREDWQAAETALSAALSREDVDPIGVRFLAGMLALGQGRLERAIAYFRDIIARRPDLHRVRLELARALYLRGEDDASRYHFELVRAADIPEPVAKNVDSFLEAIRRRRLWAVDFSVGLSPDSNINTGTRNDTVTIGGLPFQLSSDAQETSGLGLFLALGGYRAWPLSDRWSSRLSANAVRRDYRKSQFDDMNGRVSLGAARASPWGEVHIAPVLSARYFGNTTYVRSKGARADLAWRLSPTQVIQGSVERLSNDYVDDLRRDGNSLFWSLGQRIVLGSTSVLHMGVDVYRDQARDTALGSTTHGASIGYAGEYKWGISSEMQVRASASEHEAPDPLFGVTRLDYLVSWSLSISRRNWRIAGFSPVISYTYLRNASNIDLYDFDRHQYLFGMQRQF